VRVNGEWGCWFNECGLRAAVAVVAAAAAPALEGLQGAVWTLVRAIRSRNGLASQVPPTAADYRDTL
jgi:hypothetical protein